MTRVFSRVLSGLFVLVALANVTWAQADPLIYQATTSGRQALDQDAKGGNPFASALIDTLAHSGTNLVELSSSLQRLTHHYRKGQQTPQVPELSGAPLWKVAPAETGEQRIALVLVVSNYERVGVQSLPGAKFDAERIASTLRQAGFATELALDLGREAAMRRLADFAEASKTKDAAVIYTTGHGVEVGGTVYLIPGDYPIEERNRALTTRALPLPKIAEAAKARTEFALSSISWQGSALMLAHDGSW